MGAGLAAAIVPCCDCVGDPVVSGGQLGLRINCRSRRAWCVWIEFADSAPGHTRAHRHAAGIGDFSYRPADLEKNPKAARMECARPSLPLRTTNCSMLIKGPIVYAFLLPGIALFQWRGRARPHGAPACSAWSGWWPWIASLAVFLLWVSGGILFQPGFYNEVVMREFLGRFGETIHRPQPLYFYLPHLTSQVCSVEHSAHRDCNFRSGFAPMENRYGISRDVVGYFLAALLGLGGLIVMSLIPSKRVDRIFPVIPPLCLLLAAQVASRRPCSHGSVNRVSTTVESIA